MSWVVPFTAPQCHDIAVAGGKGANLAVLTAANLPVPPGFCVTTEAYMAFATEIGLPQRVEELLAAIGDDAQRLETLTAQLRSFITTSPMPEPVARAIMDAYTGLTANAYVAVRSSGTAEDLAGASFAGLHDTYLDIRGPEVVVDAVKRCWASMWTARATSYRRNKGFDQSKARIAVVVQQMVDADLAGVMFTANPMTSATDEIVVNAAYGLGEALVSGIATPDEHILSTGSLRIKEQRVGAKEVRIVRDRSAAFGTVEQVVSEEDRARFALSETQLTELGELGLRIMSLYGGFPQDIEWAISRGKLYLLQARPITGVDLSWDEDLEFWQKLPEDDNALWTRSWADEVWNGAISPLTYSYRGHMFTEAAERCAELLGIQGGIGTRLYKYHKGEAYYNADVERLFVERSSLPEYRRGLLAHTPPDAKDAILAAPFGIFQYVEMHAHILSKGYGPYKMLRIAADYLENRIDEANGMSSAALKGLSDDKLQAEFEHFVDLKTQFNADLWTGFFIYAREAMTFLGNLLAAWYEGDSATIFADLFSGLPRRTATANENLALWRLSEKIRASKALTAAFASAGLNYLDAFETIPEGREFVYEYRKFVTETAHRGHSDRDIFFRRRSEDVAIDYENFRVMLSAASSMNPEDREKQVREVREAAIVRVEASLRQKSFGGWRVWLFRRLLDFGHEFFVLRDNQRHYFDRYTFAMRRIALELGQRLENRGILRRQDEVFFLGRREIYDLFAGKQAGALLGAKIAERRRNFDLMLHKEAAPPAYLRRNRPVSFESGEGAADGSLQGVGTSRGVVTARARIVLELKNIGHVAEGEILITQSTDPGWTPVFNIIKGIVLETGGMLAHGSCLAREYGFPAVQLAGATHLIPDGALITINGDTGKILVIEPPDHEIHQDVAA